MLTDSGWTRAGLTATGAIAALLCIATLAAGVDFVSAVAATHPIAYYRLESTTGKSQIGESEYNSFGRVTIQEPGAPVGIPENHFAKFEGNDGYILTTQAGGVGGAGSIMAWVKLAILPSLQGHPLYVAGESQWGNDFDVGFAPNNTLMFFTSNGPSMSYAPPAATLVNHWHMIVVTMDTASQSRLIYWDGKVVAAQTGGVKPNKTSAFSIGGSTVFEGRHFNGGIDEVALWNRALKAYEVSALYTSTSPPDIL